MNNVPPRHLPQGIPDHPPQQQQQRGWWERNWPWFVPAGCLTLLAAPVLIFGGVILVFFTAMKSTDVYKTAVQSAKANEQVINALGSPVREGWFLTGNFHTTPNSGDADLAIPISGPKGSGKIYVTATKSGDAWNYSRMDVRVNGTDGVIHLTPPAHW